MAGRVNRVLVSTVGSAVAPGAPLVEIVPIDGAISFEAKVRPADIAAVRLGQEAKINVSAYESALYGSMTGKVVTIAPDAVTEERSGDTYYIVRIEADAASLRDRAGRPLHVGPGMTAEVNLLGEKRSVLDYVLTPITRLKDRAFRE
jgi:adhesin transport system membrane fusion protein